MKWLPLLLLFASAYLPAAEKNDLIQRVKIGEAIFAERFSAARVERLLVRGLDAELTRLDKGAAQEYVAKIRKVFSDVASDVVTSITFKDEYSGWIAGQLSKAELEAYLEFLRSDLGRKIGDLDDRVQPLIAEAIQRRSKGRLESLPLLLAEARTR